MATITMGQWENISLRLILNHLFSATKNKSKYIHKQAHERAQKPQTYTHTDTRGH